MSNRTRLLRDFKAALYHGDTLEELQKITNRGIRLIPPHKQEAVARELEAISKTWALERIMNSPKPPLQAPAEDAVIITPDATLA